MADQSDGTPTAADDPRATDEALRLIGLFFVNFSRYVSHLEHGVGLCIGIGDARVNRTVWSLTSGMEEFGLRKAFFAGTALLRESTEEERRIRSALNKRGQELATRRNDFAHGAWHLFSSTGVEAEDGVVQVVSYEPLLSRMSGRLNEEPGHRDVVTSREDLAALVQEAEDVALLVWEYITGLFFDQPGLPSLTDRLGFVDDVLVRQDLSGWTPTEQA